MWEMTIETSQQEKKIIDQLYERIQSQVKALKGVAIKEQSADRVTLCVGIPLKARDFLAGQLKEIISDIMILKHKCKYFSENLNLNSLSEINQEALLKALTVFDKHTDKEMIKSKIVLNGTINLDSMFQFKCVDLRSRWQEICDLVKENIACLLVANGVTELIKFLIKTSETQCTEVHIIEGANEVEFCNASQIAYRKFNNMNPREIVGELIEIAPEKIILHTEVHESTLTKSLCNLFEEKIEIIEKLI